MPPFTIAPWELPPDYPGALTAPAEFVFRAPWQSGLTEEPRETEIWARWADYKGTILLFFCDGEHPDRGNWVLPDIDKRIHPLHDDRGLNSLIYLFGTDWLWRKHVRRFVFFDATRYGFPGLHQLSVYTGVGFYGLNCGSFATRRISFDSGDSNSILDEGATMMKNRLLSLLGDENSQARFALNWLHLTMDQRREKLLLFQRGDLFEMRAILRAALQSQSDLWHQPEALSWQTRDWKPQGIYTGSLQGDHLTVARYPQRFPISKRLQKWKRSVWDYYRPSFNTDVLKSAQCCQLSADEVGDLAVEVSPPTQHEHLEALLTLRDWWQQNFPGQSFESQNADTPD